MNHDPIPNEIKSQICENVTLKTLKTLRLVSRAWAVAGLNLLLLPTFSLKSTKDVQRLLDIGSSPVVSKVAMRTIKTLVIPSHGWDPRYFRNIVLYSRVHGDSWLSLIDRYILYQLYEPIGFVPTEEEAKALHELDTFAMQKDLDTAAAENPAYLVTALRIIPRVNSIQIDCENPFTHPVLKKCWEEYSTQAFQQRHAQYIQLSRVLSAAKMAGLSIRSLKHTQLFSEFFANSNKLWSSILELERLSLYICCDGSGGFGEVGNKDIHLLSIIKASEFLESLCVTFETLEGVSLSFLPPRGIPKLRTLSLDGVKIHPSTFLPFLELHTSTLRQLRLANFLIPAGEGTIRDFLVSLQTLFSATIERFQLMGMVKSVDAKQDEQWFLGPSHEDWGRISKNPKVGMLEDFVVKGAEWPMQKEDTIPFKWEVEGEY